MSQKISDVFKIDSRVLKEHKVFNGFIDKDSKLYIDPRLLRITLVPEFKNADEKINIFLKGIINDILDLIELENQLWSVHSREFQKHYEEFLRKESEIKEKLIFRELPLAGLGYSTKNKKGKGIGDDSANVLLTNIKDFVKVGIVDPIIFQLAQIFVENIGPDKISDMIISIILPELAQFSSRIAETLNLPKIDSIIINNQKFCNLPCHLNKAIILVPEDILTFLPISSLWVEKNFIKHHNLELRNYMNDKMQTLFAHCLTWKDIVGDKNALKELLVEHPHLMTQLIDTYTSTDTDAILYNFSTDPKDLFNWHEIARYYAQNYHLNIENISDEYFLNNQKILETICIYFSEIVSLRGLSREFYKTRGIPKKETIAVSILSELLDYHLKDSCLSVECVLKGNIIKLSNQDKIILKFTSSHKIIESCHKLIMENNHSNSTNSITVLFLIIVNGGKSESEIKSSFYENGNNIYIESAFFKIFYIDARL